MNTTNKREAGKGSRRRKTQVLQEIADLRYEYINADKERKEAILKEIALIEALK